MSGPRQPALRVAAGLLGAVAAAAGLASEPWPEPRPIASDAPTFHAPAEPPGPEAPEPPVLEPEGPLALDDALALALLGNPELAAFSWEVRAGEARALQAGRIPNPELDFRATEFDRAEPDPDESRMRIIVSQELELGGKRARRVDLAESERDLAGWDYEAKRIEVVTLVSERFAALLGAERRVEALGRAVAFVDRMQGQVATLVRAGTLGSVENHRIARRAGLEAIELDRAKSELAVARFALAATWGSSAPRFTTALGELEPLRPVPALDALVALARQNPALARFDALLAREQAALRLAKAGRVPDVTLGAGVRWDDTEGPNLGQEDDPAYLLDVGITLPIFDRKQGDARQARYGMGRAQAERRAAEAATAGAIADAYYRLEESVARAGVLGAQVVPAARATFEALEIGMQREAGDPDDVLDARRDLTRSELDLVDALVEFHQARAALEGLVGQSL